MQDSLHTHTHYTINQIRASQSPPLKSLTSSLGPTLWGSVSDPTWDYRARSDIVCNNPRKSASHIYPIPQKDQSQLRLLVVVNKAQFNPLNTRCGTHHTPTHITQSIKLGYHVESTQGSNLIFSRVREKVLESAKGKNLICETFCQGHIFYVLAYSLTKHTLLLFKQI